MSTITTHVLDAVIGKPAAGIAVRLEQDQSGSWNLIGSEKTNVDGRCNHLCSEVPSGKYRLTFDTGAYFSIRDRKSIYTEVVLTFNIDGQSSYHLPLLLSDNSYTTYRGS